MSNLKIKSKLDLTNENILITGAFGNLGRQIIETFSEFGGNIIALDLIDSLDNEFIENLKEKYGIDFYFYPIDLSNKEDLIKTCNFINEKHNSIKCLVNNAGVLTHSFDKGWNCEFEEQDISLWEKVFSVNSSAPFILSQKLKPLLEKANGSIINISSIYGVVAPEISIYKNTEIENPAGYALSKAALNQMTKWLACYLAPHIRVNSIILGGVKRNQSELFIKKYSDNVPLKRMANPEDIKGAIIFLGTDLSAYTTGSFIYVDGGWCSK